MKSVTSENAYTFAIISLKKILPAEFSYFLAGYETDLSSPRFRPDFFVSLSKIGPFAYKVISSIYRKLTIEDILDKECGEIILRILRKWLHTGDLQYPPENIWLEFDTGEIDPKAPAASIFLGCPIGKGFAANAEYAAAFVREVKDKQLLKIDGEACDTAACHVYKLFWRTPFSHIGSMTARGEDSARLLAINFSRNGLVEYLKRICWPGNIARLNREIARFDNLFDALSLQYEIRGSEVGKNIGVEFYFLPRSGHSSTERQLQMLDILAGEGWCAREKRAMPAELNGMGQYRRIDFYCDGIYFNSQKARRDIHHLKMTFSADTPAKWKVYISEEYEWDITKQGRE